MSASSGFGSVPAFANSTGRLDLGRHLGVDRRELVVGDLEPRAEEADRILRLALLLQRVLVAVDLRVADEVAR